MRAESGFRPTRLACLGGKLALLAFLLPAPSSALGAEVGGVRLRYGFRPGASYTIVVGLNLAMRTDLEGLPPEAAGLAELAKDVKQETVLKLLLEAGASSSDGSTPVSVRIDDVQSKISLAGQVVQAQGLEERLEGATLLVGTLSRDGRVLELAPRSEADIPDASREMLSLMMQALPAFPDRDLHVGDSFDAPVRFETAGLAPDVKLETAGTAVFTLRAVEGGKARFEVRAGAAATADGKPSERMEMKASTEGTAEFDLIEGVFSLVRSELAIELFVESPMPAAPAAAAQEPAGATAPPPAVPSTIKVHGRASGPLGDGDDPRSGRREVASLGGSGRALSGGRFR